MHDPDAAARLQYVADVRARVRRSVLVPSMVLLALGAALIVHGVLIAVWPRGLVLTVTWTALILAGRPLVVWLRRRNADRGRHAAPHLRLACAGAALTAAAAAIAIGANPLIAALAAATAVAAYLARMPLVALAAVVAGIGCDALARSAQGELVFGAGL